MLLLAKTDLLYFEVLIKAGDDLSFISSELNVL